MDVGPIVAGEMYAGPIVAGEMYAGPIVIGAVSFFRSSFFVTWSHASTQHPQPYP